MGHIDGDQSDSGKTNSIKSNFNRRQHLQTETQVIVPPHKTAVCSPAGDSQRDNHIRVIDQHGRIAWQKKTGYGLRNYAELAVQRYTSRGHACGFSK